MGSNCSSRIDDEVGSTNIANHFAWIYSYLYNQVDQALKITELHPELNSKISNMDISEISRIDENIIKMALSRMKVSKSDLIFYFSLTVWSMGHQNFYNILYDVDAVVSFESFRALKPTLFESFRVSKLYDPVWEL